ncbi:hypothetical protein OIU77_024632, partial [Salix suchowensis]
MFQERPCIPLAVLEKKIHSPRVALFFLSFLLLLVKWTTYRTWHANPSPGI